MAFRTAQRDQKVVCLRTQQDLTTAFLRTVLVLVMVSHRTDLARTTESFLKAVCLGPATVREALEVTVLKARAFQVTHPVLLELLGRLRTAFPRRIVRTAKALLRMACLLRFQTAWERRTTAKALMVASVVEARLAASVLHQTRCLNRRMAWAKLHHSVKLQAKDKDKCKDLRAPDHKDSALKAVSVVNNVE